MTMKNNIETEVKFVITEIDETITKLRGIGAKFIHTENQKTIMMDTSNGDLKKRNTFLRTRTGIRNTMTVKRNLSEDVGVKQREELEIEIQDVDTLNKMLVNLGFTYHRIMEKRRHTWIYENTEIAIDELPFGIYMEIEGNKKEIYSIVQKLGFEIGDIITMTYWHIFASMTGGKVKDILFEDNHKFQEF